VIIDPEYHYEAVNVDVQQNNPQSLLWWMKRVLSLRKQYRAFGRGRFQLVHADNGKVLAFTRTFEHERLLVVANLSRFAQHAELSLPADFRGASPVELFGRTSFPRVGEGPYPLGLGPHTFYWFSLDGGPGAATAVAAGREDAALPEIAWGGSLEDLLAEENRHALERALPDILRTRTWFNPRGAVQWTEVRDVVPVGEDGFAVLVGVEYTEGEPETYLLTLMLLRGEAADTRLAHARGSVLARLRERGRSRKEPREPPTDASVLADGLWDRQFAEQLLALTGRRSARGAAGELEGWSTPEIRRARPSGTGPSLVYDRSAHTSMVFGTRFVMRVLRRIEDGPHPDVEIGRTLTEEGRASCVPPLLGALEYSRSRTQSAVVGTLHGFVSHEADAWTYTIDELGRYFERVLTTLRGATPPALEAVTELARRETPPEMQALAGVYLDSAALMGQRTADFHRALAAAPGADFTPEPFTELYQRSLVQSVRNLARRVSQRLRQRLRDVPEDARADAQRLAGLEGEIVRQVRAILARRLGGARMRYHGNLHLGQLLHTGRDFVIIMSEGEAGRSLADRRTRRSPLRDVAALLRSLHYAAAHALRPGGGAVRREDLPLLEPWVRCWRSWASAAVLRRYDQACQGEGFHARSPEELRRALWLYMMEKALSEVVHELDLRPEWAGIPVRGVLELMEAPTFV
jgi:maltose alpha-D-glucosyltransferase/alpha-amylase